MDKEGMKTEIIKLIERYNNREKGKRYNEEMTKTDFILPLFKILGWNTEDSNEVSKEENISGKRVDYGFRIDGIPKFFLEAKGLDEDLEGSRMVKGRQVTYAEQAINYAYYKGCNWAILTNFKGIVVYDAWAKSSQSSFRFAIWADSLLSDFDNNLYLLSREAFEQGLLDKKYSTKSRKRPITEQLLLDFTTFRSILSKDVYNLNKSKNLTEEELDEAIQRLFDRLIFIRNCEDRELEPYELLSRVRQWKESRKGTLVSKIRELFVHFDDTYNSKIFSKHLCDQVDISDEVLSRVLDGLYTTEDGSILYDFSLIDADVLGNIYEQYLGHILKKTKLTESKAKRKEEGIYYTPSYIVDYIVRNTVGELVKNKKLDISKITVLDPACGSGSFLIKTFDVLNEYYSKKEGYNQNKLDLSETGTTYSTKLGILKDNIFGVDLDKQAVDIAQLNLLLKIAEKKRRLPILQQNIKNGNSLIDDPNLAGDKAFKWNDQFSEIMKDGGFDVIVGNPPWVQSKFLPEHGKIYYTKNYTIAKKQYDLFTLFIERGLRLLREGCMLGFIVPDRFIANSDYQLFRKFLLENTKIRQIVQVGEGVFTGVEMPSAIIILEKCESERTRNRNIVEVRIGLNSSIQKLKQIDFYENDGFVFSIFNNNKSKTIIQKVEKGSSKLSDFVVNGRGVEIGKKSTSVSDTNGDVRFLIGSDIDRYQIKKHHYLKLGDKGINYKEPELYKGEKILIRKTGLGINAVLDGEDNYVIQVIYIFKAKNVNYNLHYLLGILNSKLMNFYYFSKFGQKERKVFPHLTQGKVLQLPIKYSKDTEKALTNRVKDILALYHRFNQIKYNSDEKIELEGKIWITNKEIDDIVYKIYGITEEEKKVIEESLT